MLEHFDESLSGLTLFTHRCPFYFFNFKAFSFLELTKYRIWFFFFYLLNMFLISIFILNPGLTYIFLDKLKILNLNIASFFLSFKYLIFKWFILIFYTIAIYNLLGLFFKSVTPTVTYWTCFILSSCIFFYFILKAILFKKKDFYSFFLPEGTAFVLSHFLIIIEMFSYIIRNFSMSVRLFANILAGHILLILFLAYLTFLLFKGSIVYLTVIILLGILLTLFSSLEIFVCIVQALIFMLLTLLWTSESYQ